MSKLNFLIFLNSYNDSHPSNSPNFNNFKWTREVTALGTANPVSENFSLAPGETMSLFSGVRTLAQDGTTEYTISLKPLSSNTYILAATGGTLPNFRTPRSIAIDATTQVTTSMNGPVLTYTSTGGTLFNTAAIQIGDLVRIGDEFEQLNQGEFKIIAKTATSFSVENEIGITEGPITLGAGFADQIQIYSAAGVQVGDTLKISGGFSLVTQGSYKVTSVAANYLEFYTSNTLPQEADILTQAIAIYSAARQLVYLESDKKCLLTINGTIQNEVEPFVINNSIIPGIFMLKSTIYSFSVTNNSTDVASLFVASVE